MDKIVLKINNLTVSYGSIKALKGIDIEVPEGQIVALLGANGAGKTTTLKTISGIVEAESGSIEFCEKNITNLSAEKITSLGIVQSPEGRQVFPDITVEENLRIGAFTVKKKKEIERNFERVYRYFPILKERRKQIAGTLSGGEQQMLAIARALMASPKLLLLDEPSLGLAPLIVKNIFEIVKEINQEGTTVLIIEQNALQTLKIADYAYVLEVGEINMKGKAGELIQDKRLLEAYLGGE
ncbi:MULTISPECIES: ABC transporter ATP-binding protein [Clostridium]|jgi:branched-chain amino acid transport system ATP-binding protein|uniref:High-affinity branched-chain amino acid transport ATP-binding protein LivF n=1 Tax=bioreactor metagenome TaxID=1076179 RepID=A0A644XG35_9ZZZZ|nr:MULTISPECIES: ABC transporter ATP-binding protein [Clostridium]KLE14883.1 amino acid ABC transporter ATPase [Clostridium sp. C8]